MLFNSTFRYPNLMQPLYITVKTPHNNGYGLENGIHYTRIVWSDRNRYRHFIFPVLKLNCKSAIKIDVLERPTILMNRVEALGNATK